MKVFVGFGFNPRDAWIRDFVFPLITAFGMDVEDGIELAGEVISDGVRQRIRASAALIGFTTRRDPNGQRWTTHRWVTDEISHALALGKPVVEVREVDVDDQGGIVGDRQRLVYDERKRDECLVKLAAVLGRWRRQHDKVMLQLLPMDSINEIVPVYRKPGFSCRYRFMVNGDETPEVNAQVKPIKGGLFVEISDLPAEGLVQVEIVYEARSWISGFESVDAIGITLRRS